MMFRIFTILAVMALAISTWILSSPARGPKPAAAGIASDTPGYYLKTAVLTDYDEAGRPSIRMDADRIDQIAHGPEIALSNVRMHYQTPGGAIWSMYGDLAHVEGAGKIVNVTGNVRLQNDGSGRTPAAVIRTDSLRYDISESIAQTDSDVRIEFGKHTLTAHGLVANLKERTMRLESKVNGRFQP